MTDKQTCDFWVGYFATEDLYYEYFGEQSDDDGEPISEFSKDQEERWYDHDSIEMGFKKDVKDIPSLVDEYSYSDQYQNELSSRVVKNGLKRFNCFVFITKGQISRPKTIENEVFNLYYLGEITYYSI